MSILLVGCSTLGDDYDHDRAAEFWASHTAPYDPSIEADAAKLSVDDQYAIYRYRTESRRPGMFYYMPLVNSGPKAIPVIKSKLDMLNDSWSIWTVAIVLRAMDGRTYDVSADIELSDALWAASERADGPYDGLIWEIAQKIAPRR